MNNLSDWFTPQEVAVRVGITAAQIRAELQAGFLMGVQKRYGKQERWFVSRAEVDRYVALRGSDDGAGRGRPCPKCRGRSRVLDTRHNDMTDVTRRRRECIECRHRWSTREIDEKNIPHTTDSIEHVR